MGRKNQSAYSILRRRRCPRKHQSTIVFTHHLRHTGCEPRIDIEYFESGIKLAVERELAQHKRRLPAGFINCTQPSNGSSSFIQPGKADTPEWLISIDFKWLGKMFTGIMGKRRTHCWLAVCCRKPGCHHLIIICDQPGAIHRTGIDRPAIPTKMSGFGPFVVFHARHMMITDLAITPAAPCDDRPTN